MRKITVLLAAIMLSLSAVAQQKPHTWKITPQVGLTASKFHKDAIVSIGYDLPYIYYDLRPEMHENEMQPYNVFSTGLYSFSQCRANSGFTIGAEAQYQFNKTFGLSVGAFYAQQGVKWNLKGILNIREIDINSLDDGKVLGQMIFIELSTFCTVTALTGQNSTLRLLNIKKK